MVGQDASVKNIMMSETEQAVAVSLLGNKWRTTNVC